MPDPPDVIVTQDRLSDVVHETFAVTPMVWPLAAEAVWERLDGFIVSDSLCPAWFTVKVRVMPPPLTVISPLREDVLVFSVTLYVTFPFPLPELPDVIVTHDRLSAVVQEMFAVTPMV